MPPHWAAEAQRADLAVPRRRAKGGLIETVVPCASEWRCAQLGANSQHDIYRCEKADGSLDRPPAALRGGRRAVCVKGSGWGTLCELTDLPEGDPWAVDGRCSPGATLWCPASKESWGQVSCGGHGRWATRLEGTVQVLDCRPLPGRGPDSGCTCFLRHGSLSAECCERPDCVVPPGGEQGRSCDPSTGALCDYCDVSKPECASGGLCMVTGGENYCARDCSQAACPTGFRCAELPGSGKHQCLPEDGSCYF